MHKIPTSKVVQTADILREAIATGEWARHLPGERSLARDLMVSRACLRQALDILTREGVLARAEQSKRREIMAPRGRTGTRRRRVVFFTPEPAHKAAPLVLEQIARLRYFLAKAEISVELVASPVFTRPHTSDQTMRHLVGEHSGAHWILHQCPEHIQRWFDQNNRSATVFGSPFSGVDLPYVDIDFKSAARHAAGRLIARGHRRLGIIRFRSHLAGDDLALDGMREACRLHQGDILPDPVVLCHNFHVERLTASIDRLYAAPLPPTAWIVMNHHHFVTTYTHLLSRGVMIPENVSMVSLCHDAILDRLSPLPASYKVGDRLIRTLSRMVINSAKGSVSKSSLLVPDLQPGATVADCAR